MYLPRSLGATLKEAARHFPAVVVTGPRQSGKTTFLRHELPEAAYVSFDDPQQRAFAYEDPNGFLDTFGSRPVILDEIQYAPELLSYLKMRIDADRRRMGRFFMTGSQRFSLMKEISDSLAGRIAVLDLLPFHAQESERHIALSLEDCLWLGGYPENIISPTGRDLWLSSYVQTYLERDVRQIVQVQDLRPFETFLRLCAAHHAQTLNLSSLGRNSGVSAPTAGRWLGVLEASYIVMTLPPYLRNFSKRLIKTPKLYFLDSAICAFLTSHRDKELILSGPMGGAFFEGFIIAETRKILSSRNANATLSFWRTSDGLEVDLIIEKDRAVWPIEIKKTATPTMHHIVSLRKFMEFSGKVVKRGMLVCTVSERRPLVSGIDAVPWRDYLAWLTTL